MRPRSGWAPLPQPRRPVRPAARAPASAAPAAASSACGGVSTASAPSAPACGFLALLGHEVGHLHAAVLALGDRVGQQAHDQRRRADRVVVSGDDEVGVVGVAVRVDQADHRDVQAPRLADGERLLLHVDHHDGVGQLARVGHAAQVRLELLELRQRRRPLLGGQQVELALALLAAQPVQGGDPLLDRAVVGQEAAEPAVVDVGHADPAGVLGDRVLGLLLGAHEQHRAVALADVADVVERLVQKRHRLLEVDDVDAAALAEDEAAHLGVPASRLVAEVDSGLEQLSHCDRWHGHSF